MTRVLEIRSYQLKNGGRERFHQLMSQQSLPLLRAAGIDVIDCGPSLHRAEGYYLIRSYDSLEHLEASEDAFYASAAWRGGPREEILSLIESYLDAVVQLNPEAIEAIRRSHTQLGTAPP